VLRPVIAALCVATCRTKNLKGTIVLGPDIEQYRADIDSDEGLAAKRRLLVIISLLLLALSISGASIKEANTFIFRIEFSNHVGLTYLLGAAVIFLLLRYYAYAQHYQSKLFDFWSARLLNDYRVFSYNSKTDGFDGLLGKRIDIWSGDEQGIKEPRYKKVGMLKRNLVYTSEGQDEEGGTYNYEDNIELNQYSETWTRKNFRKLLIFEIKYRIEAILKHREYLDLMFPYILGITAIISLIYKVTQ
jgi:hypothetical protein